MKTQIQWKTYWENQLEPGDHAELAEFFRNTYGAVGAWNVKHFKGSRSWAGARPELRIIGHDERGVAAHFGVLRRFIRLGTIDQLVAEVGLYAVRPDLQRSGIGYQSGINVMIPTLLDLKVPFGFGTVRQELREHVEKASAALMIVSGVRVRSTNLWDKSKTCVEDLLVLVIPLERAVDEWPAGELIDRNGPEL